MTRPAPAAAPAVALAFALGLGGCGQDPAKLYEAADAAREMGLHQAALDRYLKIDPARRGDFPRLEERIGDCYAALGKTREALDFWGEAGRKDPENAGVLTKRGAFLIQAGRQQEGMDTLRKAVAIDPKDGAAHLALGAYYLREGNLPASLTHLAKAAEIDPENPTVLKSLGAAFIQAGHNEKGAILLFQAWRRDPAAMPPRELFKLMVQSKRWREAAEVGEAMADRDPDPEFLLDYADALIRAGDGVKGSRIYRAMKNVDLPPALAERVARVLEATRRLNAAAAEPAGTAAGAPPAGAPPAGAPPAGAPPAPPAPRPAGEARGANP